MKKILISITMTALFVGCGSSSSSKVSIDIADYLPSENIQRMFLQTTDSGGNNVTTEDISIHGNIITIKVEDVTTTTITKDDEFISVKEIDNNLTKIYTRSIPVGSKLYTLATGAVEEEIKFGNTVIGTKTTESTKKCILESKESKLDDYSITYTGDILKFKCTDIKLVTTKVKDDLPDYINLKDGEKIEKYDISYFYIKKDIGLIADVNKDCIIKKDGIEITDDSLATCKDGEERHVYKFLL